MFELLDQVRHPVKQNSCTLMGARADILQLSKFRVTAIFFRKVNNSKIVIFFKINSEIFHVRMEAQWDEVVEEYYWATVDQDAADHVQVCWSLGFKGTPLCTIQLLRCCVRMTFTGNREFIRINRKKGGKIERTKKINKLGDVCIAKPVRLERKIYFAPRVHDPFACTCAKCFFLFRTNFEQITHCLT
jgi:hypothetical protein